MENAYNFLVILLQDNEQLKNYLAGYLNTILSLKTAYPKTEMESEKEYIARLAQTLKPEEKNTLLNQISAFRIFAVRIKISLTSIAQEAEIEEKILNKLTECFQTIQTEAIPGYFIAEEYTQQVSNILEKSINTKALLNTKQKLGELANITKNIQIRDTNAAP